MTSATADFQPLRIVITGGPCAGKSSVMQALAERFTDTALVVPEAATMLFEAGYPLPSPEWSEEQWLRLQHTITGLQVGMEDMTTDRARAEGKSVVLCDRAPFDNVAYPQGANALRQLWGPEWESQREERYFLVIHLESLATADPERFGATGNATRYESLDQAQALELQARLAWNKHRDWKFVSGKRSVSELAQLVGDIIEAELSPAPWMSKSRLGDHPVYSS